MSFHVPEEFREKEYSSASDGNNGLFFIYERSSRQSLKIIASDGMGWEHVSVSKLYDCPSWLEMCKVKNMFWDKDDLVVQYHPPESEYVNNHPFCLHLWRPTNQEIPLPPNWMVGVK